MSTDVMTGITRLKAAFRSESTDRIPWTPFVGVHAAALLGESAEAYLKSEDLIVQGVQAAIDRYHPDGLPVLFDLQLEAEILGCDLVWAAENPPSVSGHPLASGVSLSDLAVPRPDQGRLPLVLNAARRLREANPDVALYGLITGPFTLALHLMGTDIFMKMFDAPESVAEVLRFCRDVGVAMAGYYIDAGCEFIAVVDPMTSQIGPEQFAQFVTPVMTPIFDAIRAAGRLSSFFVCGHAQQNVQAMCECGPDNVSVDENIPLQFVGEVCRPRGVSFGGNMQLTTVLLLGTPNDAQRNALECMDIGGDNGFILAPGCDLPYATPPENLEAVSELVVDPYKQDVARALTTEAEQGVRLDMREYGQLDKVIVDVITLDSEACAPCQYMVNAVQKVAPQFDGIVHWREHKIKSRESLVFMDSLMVRNVPTICIDGQITFVSRIPPRDELIAAIQSRINEKLRSKLQHRRATLLVLGPDDEDSREVLQRVRKARTELGADVMVEHVTDPDRIASFGVAPNETPAVIAARYKLKSVASAPEPTAIKEWIKDLE